MKVIIGYAKKMTIMIFYGGRKRKKIGDEKHKKLTTTRFERMTFWNF